MKIHLIWPRNIPAEKNRGFYQRISHLSQNHEVTIFTLKSSEVAEEIRENITLIRMPSLPGRFSRYYDKLMFNLWCFYKAIKVHVKNSPDVIYTIHYFDYFLGFLLSRITKAKWVIDGFHSPYYHYDFAKLNGWLFLKLRGLRTIFIAKRILRYVDLALVMAHSREEGFAKILIEEFYVPSEKVAAIPDGVDLEIADPLKFKSQQERKDFNIFYIGGMSRQKARELLYSVEMLTDRIPDLKLTLVGHVAKEFERELSEVVAKSKGQIEYQSRVPHEKALELMANADVCVCSVDSEVRDYQYSHPGKIFEYLAMGKVAIASNLEGIRGIVKHEENGLLYLPDDSQALAEEIYKVYKDRDLREKLEKNARESVRKFNWKILNRELEARFTTLHSN